MRSTPVMMVAAGVAALLIMFAGDARAQQASLRVDGDPDSEQLQRIPALVVREFVTPSPVADGPSVKTQGAPSKNAASKSPAAGAPRVVSTAQPLVLPPISTSNPEQISTGNLKYDELIALSAVRNGLDPNLIVAVMRQESGFNPRARSYKNAQGLMQLIPATAYRFGVTNIMDPAQNIEGGAKYLRFLLDTFNGDVNLALAGYNAGENAVVNSGYRIPRYRETQNYVRSISSRYDARGKVGKTAASPSGAPSAAVFSGGAASSRLSNNY
ncbi:MAG TPA: lytic transglycosylase domain-containing protein [Blastocatellia bacterium]|nr:lytic transglycosylase domain-containing protein [Blastocatellia bacterium]